MATIKDIAQAAGVSHATVSNVLNHKGIVSAEKVKLVQDTARAMGYRLNEAASALRSGNARVLAVVLPDTESAVFDDLYRSLYQSARERGYSTMLRLTGNMPAMERSAIHDILSARARYVVAVTSLSDPEGAYAELARSGAELAFALRGGPENALFGGFDMEKAADDIARRVLAEGAGCVGLMTNLLSYPSEAAFRDTLAQRLAQAGTPMLHVQSITSQYGKNAFSLFSGDAIPDAVVTTDESMARAVRLAGAYLGLEMPRVYTLSVARLLQPTAYTCYSLNARRLGAMLCRALMDSKRQRILLPGDGFVQERTFHRRRAVLRMLSNDSPFSRALIRLSPRFEADTGVRLTVDMRQTNEVSRALERPEELSGFDVARMDMALLDVSAKRCFVPLEELALDREACQSVLLEGIQQEYGQLENTCYALPYDPSCHLLFYRQDLMDNPHFMRRYYETYREQPAPFATYEQYRRAAECLDQIAREEGLSRRGALLTGRSSEYLADLVSLSPDGKWPALTVEDMEAFIERRRGLGRVALWVNSGSWSTAAQCFARGESAMMIAHSNYVGYLADDPLSSVSGRVGFAPSPGKWPLLGGGVIGALKTSPRLKEAAALLQWLYSPRVRDLLALLSGCSPCRSAYENEEITDIYPWLSAVRQGLQVGVRRAVFPGERQSVQRMETERRIAQLCVQAVEGKLSAQETLEAVDREALGMGAAG